MLVLATQFPIQKRITNNDFSDLAILWLSGIKKSKVLTDASSKQLYDDDARIEADNGEIFSLKKVEFDNVSAIGLLHDLPDELGRLWRTECVLSRRDDVSFIQLKTECNLLKANALPETPKRPVLISMMLEEGWGALDDTFLITNQPQTLTESDIRLASSIITGKDNARLPCVYISRDGNDRTIVDPKKLAANLAGLAHVIVEPSRGFSFNLMSNTSRQNPYGGTIGICVPSRGVIRKFYKRDKNNTAKSISSAIAKSVIDYLSSLRTGKALDWRSLQELHTKTLRRSIEEKLKNASLSNTQEIDKYMEVFDGEIKEKDEIIENLEHENMLLKAQKTNLPYDNKQLLNEDICNMVGTELYHGEAADRVRLAINEYLKTCGEEIPDRHKFILEKIYKKSTYSGGAFALTQQIKSAGKDTQQMPKQIGSILMGFGFTMTSEGKHTKCMPPSELGGLNVEMLPKTPSDSHAGKNKAADLIKSFDINRFKD